MYIVADDHVVAEHGLLVDETVGADTAVHAAAHVVAEEGRAVAGPHAKGAAGADSDELGALRQQACDLLLATERIADRGDEQLVRLGDEALRIPEPRIVERLRDRFGATFVEKPADHPVDAVTVVDLQLGQHLTPQPTGAEDDDPLHCIVLN